MGTTWVKSNFPTTVFWNFPCLLYLDFSIISSSLLLYLFWNLRKILLELKKNNTNHRAASCKSPQLPGGERWRKAAMLFDFRVEVSFLEDKQPWVREGSFRAGENPKHYRKLAQHQKERDEKGQVTPSWFGSVKGRRTWQTFMVALDWLHGGWDFPFLFFFFFDRILYSRQALNSLSEGDPDLLFSCL